MILRLLGVVTLLGAALCLLLLPFRLQRWRQRLLSLATGLVFAGVCFGIAWWQKQYQFDQARGLHLAQLAAKVDAYRQQQGHWPLTDAAEAFTVRISSRPLPDSQGRLTELPATDLQGALALDRLPTDPQKATIFAPNWYEYRVERDSYQLTAHLFHPRSCTRKAGFGNHLLRVGTAPGALTPAQLKECFGLTDGQP